MGPFRKFSIFWGPLDLSRCFGLSLGIRLHSSGETTFGHVRNSNEVRDSETLRHYNPISTGNFMVSRAGHTSMLCERTVAGAPNKKQVICLRDRSTLGRSC